MAPFPTPEISPSPATMHPFPAFSSSPFVLHSSPFSPPSPIHYIIGAWVELYRMVRKAIQLCEVTSM